MNTYPDTIATVDKVDSALAEAKVIYLADGGHYTKREMSGKPWECFAWRCTFKEGNSSATFDYYCGLAHAKPCNVRDKYSPFYIEPAKRRPIPPRAADVLHNLIADSGAADMCFSDWCSEFGYSDDSIKALTTYQQCCENGRRLRGILGADLMAELTTILEDY